MSLISRKGIRGSVVQLATARSLDSIYRRPFIINALVAIQRKGQVPVFVENVI
jgi:hypothetical protein